MCAPFLSHLLLLYIGRVHGAISRCTVLWEVHPASAQNKSLISDTGLIIRVDLATGFSERNCSHSQYNLAGPVKNSVKVKFD